MRNEFIKQLTNLTKINDSIILLTADLGYGVLDNYAKLFPKNFINVGVAEQNMANIASGLALSGKTVFIYSIANFPTLRCLEQIRNNICYHNLNVKIVSVGAGFAYGSHGYTHQGIEDISIMRSLPNLKLYSPADPKETQLIMRKAISNSGPCYIRLGKAGEHIIHKSSIEFSKKNLLPIINNNNNTLVLSSGSITKDALNLIVQKNIKSDLYSAPCINEDLDLELSLLAKKYEIIITLEEHQLAAGFGSIIIEKLANLYANKEIPSQPIVHRIGISSIFEIKIGSQNFMRYQLIEKLEKTLNTIIVKKTKLTV